MNGHPVQGWEQEMKSPTISRILRQHNSHVNRDHHQAHHLKAIYREALIMSYSDLNPGTPAASSIVNYSSDNPLHSDSESETEMHSSHPVTPHRPHHTKYTTPKEGSVSVQRPLDEQNLTSSSNPGSPFLTYRGYLNIDHTVYTFEFEKLRSGRDVSPSIIDVLLAQAHAVAYEHNRTLMSNRLIFPTSFGRSLLASTSNADPAVSPDEGIVPALEAIAAYPSHRIWQSSTLLIPFQHSYQWILVAVTNLVEAVSQDFVGPRLHDVLHGDSRPDRTRFTILVLSSSRLIKNKSLTQIPQRVRAFLNLSWEQLRGTKLEFVDFFIVKCPEQEESVGSGLHVVHNAELLMRPGVAEDIRKVAQSAPKKRKRLSPSPANAQRVTESHQNTSDEEARRQRKRLRRLQKAGRANAVPDAGGQGSNTSMAKEMDELQARNRKDKTDEGNKSKKKSKRAKENSAQNARDHSTLDQEIPTTTDGRSRPVQSAEPPSGGEPRGSTSITTHRPQQMEVDSSSTTNNNNIGDSASAVHAHDTYGPGVPVGSRTEKLFATIYYPQRTEPFKVPCGKLLPDARAARYEGMSTQEVATRTAEHERAFKNCPLVFQEAFKGTARGHFDREVHMWLVPILWNYHNRTQRGDRIQYLQSTIRDLFKVFRDLHPDFLKLKDVEMELDYHGKIRNRISTAYYQIARTLKIPGKLEFIDKEVVKYLVEGGTRQRAHDLWAKAEIAKGGSDSDESDADGDEVPSASTFVKDWQAEMERQQRTMSSKRWRDHRLEIEQEFRKREFEKLGETAKAFWNAQANADEKPVDEMAGLARGLPFVNLVLSRFSKLTGAPVLVLVGAPDYNDPTKLLVYHDLCNVNAPADIHDFWNGPDQFGELTILPRWRGYVEDYYGWKRGETSIQSLSMPTFVEAEAQEVGAPAPEVPAATVIEIPWTPEPENWVVNSKEKSMFKANLQRGLADAYKKTFSKPKVDFNSLAQRPLDFVERERIPVCTMFCSFNDDGTMALQEIPEGHHADLAWPGNPTHMPPPHLHAYYHNLFDSDVPDAKRFCWKPSLAAGGYIPSTILIGGSQGTPTVPEKTFKTQAAKKSTQPAKKSAQPAKRSSLSKKSKQPPSPATSDDEREMSTESDTPSPDDTKDSEDEEETESESESENSDAPEVELRQQMPVLLKTGRLSKPTDAQSAFDASHSQSSKGKDKGKAVDPAERPLESNNRLSNTATLLSQVEDPVQLPQNSSNGRLNATSELSRALYRFRPNNAKVGKLIPSSGSKHIGNLSLREDGQNLAGLSKLPTLCELIQRCAELDCTFPPAQTSSSLPWCIDGRTPKVLSFCQELTSATRPVPTFLQFTSACSTDGQGTKEVLESIIKHVEDTVDYLEGLNMAETGPKMLPVFSSWTPIFLACARLLDFISCVPADDYPDIMERFKLSHRRTIELAIMALIIRYCGSTVTEIVSTLPAPTPSSTIANALAVIGSAWLRYLASLSRPINKLDLCQVLGSNWATQVNPSGKQDVNLPFFNLDSASLRWLSFMRTSKLEAEIMSLHTSLKQDGELFRRRSVFEQFTIIGSIAAVHTGATRKTDDERWLQAIDRLRSRIDDLARSLNYETLHLNRPPPPTLIETTPPVPPGHSSKNVSASSPRGSEQGNAGSQTLAPPSTIPSTSTEQHPGATKLSTLTGPSTDQIGAEEPDQAVPEPSERRASYKRPRKKTERSSWIAGDVLRVVHEGEMRQVMVRQKGPIPSNLVLTSPDSRTILLGPDGSDSPLPSFDLDLLLERGPIDPRMHPNCFVREQPLPPFIPLEEIATGRHNEYFEGLWQKYPEEPTPPGFDDDFIDSYEEYETADRLKNLLLDRSRRELFRAQCNLPASDYDIRLGDLIEEVTALAALEREPPTSPACSRSPSSPTSSHSSTESFSSPDEDSHPGEKSNEQSHSSEDEAANSLNHGTPPPSSALHRSPRTSKSPSASLNSSRLSLNSSRLSSNSSRLSSNSYPLANIPMQPASEHHNRVIGNSSSSDSSEDDGSARASFVPPSRIRPGPDVQASDPLIHPGKSGMHGGSFHGDTQSEEPECNSQSDAHAKSVNSNEAVQPAPKIRNDSLNEEAPAQSQLARVEGAHVERAHGENAHGGQPGPPTAEFDDTDGEPITGLENQINVQHPSPKAAMQGFENVPLLPSANTAIPQASVSADIQDSEQELNIPASKPRGPPRGPRLPAGPPTRSSPRISTSATGSNVPVPTPINPSAKADVTQTKAVSRNTRSGSKSTSGNTPATPRAARATKKTTSRSTTSTAGKNNRKSGGKP
ncbi:hypothetical protein FRC01_009128 [Tulasnella sp. 417]|nr:hypothetical protein FRC01_009128 [Tulasnella sp. 417]